MALVQSDIKFYYTGGAGNTDPNASLGGVRSNTEVGTTIDKLFADVGAAEALAGSTKYRSIDGKNTNGVDSGLAGVLWIDLETISADTTIWIGYDTGTQSVANENTAPNSPAISFVKPLTRSAGIVVGDMVAGATKRIWFKRVVTAGAVYTAQGAPDNGEITLGLEV